MPASNIKKRKKIIVLIVPRFEDFFHSFYAEEIIKGVSHSASRLRVDILIHVVNRDSQRGWLDSSLLDAKYIDGIIFADIENNVSVVKQSIRRGIPTLVLNNYLTQPFNCISVANYQAAVDAVEHFVRLGHERIATVAGEQMTQSGQTRLMGFCDAMKTIGLRLPKPYIQFGNFLRTPARQAAQKLLSLKNRPTAIFAASDVMALEVLDVARRKGISVPDELSIIGFDDNPLAASNGAALSTFSQPLAEMGRMGVEYLKKILGAKERLPLKLVLPTTYIERKTTKKIYINQCL